MGLGGYIVLISAMLLLMIYPSTNAEARNNSLDIGIALSKQCITMIKNNFTNNCPGYDEILSIIPDTSNPKYSGGFEYVDGFYERAEITEWKGNQLRYYEFDDPIVWIDPPGEIRRLIKMITIENTLPDYLIRGVSFRMENNTITMGHERFVSSGCYTSSIAGQNWLFLLGDTLHYMNNDCDPEFTQFNSTKIYYQEKSYQDIATSYKYQFDKWIAESKINCLTICKEY